MSAVMGPPIDAASEVLEVRDLRFRYGKGDQDLFSGLTHCFAPGLITAVIGPSGRGKSTLLYILGLVLRPSGGEVLVGGVSSSGWSDARRSAMRARSFGFVFQDAALDPHRSLLQGVMEPGIYGGASRADARRRATTLLERLGLAERSAHLPAHVSGGQGQRAAIARALLLDPPVILADEPTGNLDPESASSVIAVLADAAASGRTVVIATHDPFVISRADEVMCL